MTADPFILRGFCSGIELHSRLRQTTAVIPSLPAAGGENLSFFMKHPLPAARGKTCKLSVSIREQLVPNPLARSASFHYPDSGGY
jgi:hypothetical protein